MPEESPAHKPEDKEYLRVAARAIDKHLPDQHGFILLTMPFGAGGRCSYISSIQREDAIKTIKEFLFRIGESEAWMEHIK